MRIIFASDNGPERYVIVVKGTEAMLATLTNYKLFGYPCPCCMEGENRKEIDTAVFRLLDEGGVESVIWPNKDEEILSRYSHLTVENYAFATQEEADVFMGGVDTTVEPERLQETETERKSAIAAIKEAEERLELKERQDAEMFATVARLVSQDRLADAEVYCRLKGWKISGFIKSDTRFSITDVVNI